MKNIQAGFLTFPPFQQPSHPELVEGQWLWICWKGSLFLFRKGRDYSGGPVPEFSLQDGNHGVPFTWVSLL